MKIRTRLAVLLALALLVAGASVVLVSALTYQQSVYSDPRSLNDALLKKLGVTHEQVIDYIRAHPEAIFDPKADPRASGAEQKTNEVFQALQRRGQRAAVNRARFWSLVTVALLALLAGVIGWVLAGNMLRPLRLITARARSASANDLSNRVALDGPDDELKQLADTFDAMLARLEQSFLAQQHFSAQVSHELRSPLAVIRNEVELLLSDERDPSLSSSLSNIRAAGLRAERLVTALLVLARSESGNLQLETVALDDVVGGVLGQLVESEDFRALRVDVELHSVQVIADESLLESLVRNLVDNAARHNRDDGWLRIRVRREGADIDARGLLEVENSTQPVPGDDVTRLTTTEPSAGNQIGRTVVQSIVDAHHGTVDWTSQQAGVVLARVALPLTRPVALVGDRTDASTHSTDDAVTETATVLDQRPGL